MRRDIFMTSHLLQQACQHQTRWVHLLARPIVLLSLQLLFSHSLQCFLLLRFPFHCLLPPHVHCCFIVLLVSSVVIQFPVFQASNAVKTNNSVPVAQGIKFSICYFTQRCMSLYRPILGERRHIIMDAAHVWLQWRSTRERLHYVFRCIT